MIMAPQAIGATAMLTSKLTTGPRHVAHRTILARAATGAGLLWAAAYGRRQVFAARVNPHALCVYFTHPPGLASIGRPASDFHRRPLRIVQTSRLALAAG